MIVSDEKEKEPRLIHKPVNAHKNKRELLYLVMIDCRMFVAYILMCIKTKGVKIFLSVVRKVTLLSSVRQIVDLLNPNHTAQYVVSILL
jgi:hypothetical protein